MGCGPSVSASRVIDETVSDSPSLAAATTVAAAAPTEEADCSSQTPFRPSLSLTTATLKLIIEHAPNGIIVTDAASRILLVNAQVELMFRCVRPGEIIGLSVDELVPRRLRGGHPEFRRQYIARPEIRPMGAGREVFALRRDGTEVEVEVGLSPVLTAEGMLILVSIIDITPRRAAEALLKAKIAAEEALRSRSVLLSTLSHEVRTPLTGIVGCLELLRTQQQSSGGGERVTADDDATRADLLATCAVCADTLEVIVNNVLCLSQLEANALPHEVTPVDPRALLAEVSAVIRRSAEGKGLNWTASTEHDVPAMVHCDATHVKRILLNLASNAVNFTSSGSLHLALCVESPEAYAAAKHAKLKSSGGATFVTTGVASPFAATSMTMATSTADCSVVMSDAEAGEQATVAGGDSGSTSIAAPSNGLITPPASISAATVAAAETITDGAPGGVDAREAALTLPNDSSSIKSSAAEECTNFHLSVPHAENTVGSARADCDFPRHPLSADGSTCHLRWTMTDTGPGIPSLVLAQLFSPFARGDASTTRAAGGAGLGLAISQQLADLMGGFISVQSSEGAGSQFSLHLPVRSGTSGSSSASDGVFSSSSSGNVNSGGGSNAVSHGVGTSGSGNNSISSNSSSNSGDSRNIRSSGSHSSALSTKSNDTAVVVGTSAAHMRDMQQHLAAIPAMLTDASAHAGPPSVNAPGLPSTNALGPPSLNIPNSLVDVSLQLQSQSPATFAQQQQQQLHAAISSDAQQPATSRSIDILLAEDSLVCSKLVDAMLRRLGYTHVTAAVTDGQAAVAAVAGREALHLPRFNLVLMDVEMPIIDGLGATAAIHRMSPATPIVAMTANCMAGDKAKCLDAGMCDFLQKPVRLGDLQRCCERWCRG